MKFKLVVGPQEIAFDGVDLCLSVGWNFKVDLFEMDDSELWLDKLPVEVFLAHDSKEYLHPKVWEFSSELHFIVSVATVFAAEGGDDDLSEEGYFCHEESSLSILLAVGA